MNAAARLVHQRVLSRHLIIFPLISRQYLLAMLLGVAILVSALSMIYITHLSRALYADYQHSLTMYDHLHLQRSRLLLERSAWIMPARVQQIAEKKIGMYIPDHQSVVIIQE